MVTLAEITSEHKSIVAQPIVKKLNFMITDFQMIGKRMDNMELWR